MTAGPNLTYISDMSKMKGRPKGARGVSVPSDVQAAVRAVVTERGEKGAAEFFGLNRGTIARVAGGCTVQRGTLSVVQAKLEAS